jgi:hypothetical protein
MDDSELATPLRYQATGGQKWEETVASGIGNRLSGIGTSGMEHRASNWQGGR